MEYSYNKIWSEDALRVAEIAEVKNCRLVWDRLQSIYMVVKKFPDGSFLNTRETFLFKSTEISEVNTFINSIIIEMTNPNDPASPVMHPDGTFKGMTKREEIAKSALAGLISNGVPEGWKDREVVNAWSEWAADLAVEMTDELIKRLNK
jgi:hypothetical protein